MAVKLLFDSVIKDGGGYYESLNTVIEINKRIDVKVLVLQEENINLFSKLGIPVEQVKLSYQTRLLNKLESTTFIPLNTSRTLFNENVHFLTPSRVMLNKKVGVFSGTIWDLCHIDNPIFPEVGSYNEYNFRNYMLERYFSRMNFVVVDSDETSLKLERYFRIPLDRILVLPFSIPPTGKLKPLPNIDEFEKFFFYPAQLWKHKNHKNLLRAFEQFLKHRSDYSLVLAGGHKDPKVLQDINEFCEKYPANIQYLGFIDYDCIMWLYSRCSALVFPSYFGPTNIPPLEALNAGAELILSMSMQDIFGNVATYFDPSDPRSILETLIKHADKRIFQSSKNKNFLVDYQHRRENALDLLAEKLIKQSHL